jgi:CelD/BcsL family acetyltransferase involved in cellulose biosynthesis
MAEWPSRRFRGYWSEDPYVDLDALREQGDPYLSALSRNTRSKIRRSIRLYEDKYGEASLEVAADPAVAKEWLDELIHLHSARWLEQGLPGAFATHGLRRFHGLVIDRAFEEPRSLGVDILRVRFGSRTIGLLYNLRRAGVVSFYQSGFRYEPDDNRLKPGLVAHALAVQHYLEAGDREYDFLAGEPEASQYKRSLSTHSRQLLEAEAPTPSLRMWAIGSLLYAKRWVERTARRVRAS